MKSPSILLIAIAMLVFSCAKKVSEAPSEQKVGMVKASPFVEDLLAKMTLDEKIGQMNQYNGFWDVTGPPPTGGGGAEKYENLKAGKVGSMLNVTGTERVRKLQEIAVKETRLGIPLIFGQDVIHGFKTLSPIPLAEAASWDMEAIRKSAAVAAAEAAASGINWTFAPMVDISRDARWGRVMEGAGEDPYLGSLVATARVKGFQGDDLKSPFTIASCTKHYAAYGFAEGGRDYNTVDVSPSTLHNVILPPFKAAVMAGTKTLMNSFNDLNGIPATAHQYILRDVLKGSWGFNGFVVSDWGSIGELPIHGYAKDAKQAAEQAVKAGSDMDMESYFYLNHLKDLVNEGKVPVALIDDAVRRILTVKEELGLFDDPFKYCDAAREKAEVYKADYRTSVRDMAKKSIVLLKNQNELLPLKSGQKVAVIGPHVKDKNSPLGSWRIGSDDNTAVSLWEGLQAHKNIDWMYAEGVKLTTAPASFQEEVSINKTDTSGFAEAVRLASMADVVLLNIGEHGFMTGEGRSRTDIKIPGLQEDLMKAILKVNKNVVLVLQTGRPLDISEASGLVPSVLLVWQLGTESGNAIADVVTGMYNPSGKLPMSFPRNVGQVPMYYNMKNTGRPTKDNYNPNIVFWSHYGDSEKTALYPFGYGLSYTSFSYGSVALSINTDGSLTAGIKVTNTGKVEGEEVVQLYIRDKVASSTRPVKELKGFEKIMLEPGASKQLMFKLTQKDLSFYNEKGVQVFEPGEFDIMIGPNSEQLQLASIEL